MAKHLRNSGVVYAGKVGARMRPRRSTPAALRSPRKTRVILSGGPLAQTPVWLCLDDPSQTTLPLAASKGYGPGRYVRGKWEDLSTERKAS